MIAAVQPTSSGFGGGVLATAGRPTAVGGSFASPGTAAGTPTGVPSSGSIIEARNNKGSNVQVPYARLVPMHSRENVQAAALETRNGNRTLRDKRLLVVNGAPQLEYDGLHQGELAWILGRRFKSGVGGGQGTDGITEFTEMERFAHQAFAGLGSGVDRMQRLASTGWVQSLFEERLGSTKIQLHDIRLDSPYAKAMDSGILQFSKYLVGANVIRCPDVAWWRAQLEGTAKALADVGYSDNDLLNKENGGRRAQGINLMDTSPFLRGVQVDGKVVRFDEHNVLGSTVAEDLARNQGDLLCMAALETELRRRNIMDWTPDGIVLSKLESPTDSPMTSTEIDARQAQLFNIGIQGPSITKSWTSDVRNSRLEVQPMDKVFVVVVATLSFRVNRDGNDIYQNLRDAQHAVLKALVEERTAIKNWQSQAKIGAAKQKVKDAIAAAEVEAGKLQGAIETSEEPLYDQLTKAVADAKAGLDAVPVGTSNQVEKQKLADAETKLAEVWNRPTASEINKIREHSQFLRNNDLYASKANLTNFRLMRTTSSHMANYSFYKFGDEHSRLNLRIGRMVGTSTNFSCVQDVIVGGWCIGTVVDSAASRSTIGFQTVKSHPTSMAINVNVNVQWWSGDKLYKHYYDASGLIEMRGSKREYDKAGNRKVNLN